MYSHMMAVLMSTYAIVHYVLSVRDEQNGVDDFCSDGRK